MTPRKNIYLFVMLGLVLAFLLPACTSAGTVDAAILTPVVIAKTPSTAKKVLNMWHPQSPTTLNPYLTSSIRDKEPSRIVYEPLASFNQDGELVPILASEIPTLENGGLSADGKSVIWKLRKGLRWSDGEAFTAQDVSFTYSYVTTPEINADSASQYSQIENVKILDDVTVEILFKNANSDWTAPFVGGSGVILPKHVFEAHKGIDALNAPENTMPVGTGPYRVVKPGIKPQEVILLGSQVVKTTKIVYEPNPYYRFPKKIAFDRIVWRGGGTVSEAARLLYKEGSLDVGYTFETLVPAELSAIQTEKGRLVTVFDQTVIKIALNRTNPNQASEDQEFSSLKVPHPLFSDIKIRQAIAYAIDRDSIAKLYGANGRPAYVNLITPLQYQSKQVFYEYNPDQANALLDEAGCLDKDGDSFREKNGVKMKLVFQGSASSIVQATQKIVEQNLKKIGIDVEIKIVDPGVMFASGMSNPDSLYRFNADMITFSITGDKPNPSDFMSYSTCTSIPQQSNKWAGLNIERWCNQEYDVLFEKANIERDPAKRQAMFIQLNDMLIKDVVMIPLVWRAKTIGVSQRLEGLDITPWDYFTWNIADWHFSAP